MPKSFHKYVLNKDNYCCCYLGNSPEYVIFLKLLKPQIESQLPGLKLWISCIDEFQYLIEGESNSLTLSELNKRQEEFSHIRELRNSHEMHSILKLMIESKLEIKPIEIKEKIGPKICLICPEGISPVNSLTEAQLKSITAQTSSKGYCPMIVGSDVHHSLKIKTRPSGREKHNYIDNVGWVIGVENEFVCFSAMKGIKTTLINSGPGINLFKSLFPSIEVISLV